jgi:hypothetical protein
MKSARSQKKLHVESLETRNLLAGNVGAFISGGDLFVTGDDAANTITIESAGVNTVQVRGFNSADGTPTSVKGSPNALRIFNNFTGDIFINMKGGDDVVRITNLVVPGAVIANAGQGSDEILTGHTTVGDNARFGNTPSGSLYVQGDFKVVGDVGADTLFQSGVHVQGVGVANLGDGNDTLRVQRPAGSGENVEYAANLTVLPGNGNDAIDVEGLIVDDNLVIDDATGALNANLRSMDVHANFSMFTDQAADRVEISATNTHGELLIVTEGGEDFINVSAIANRLRINSGSENDQVRVASSNLDTLYTQLGTGADSLELLSVYTHQRIDALGNNGNDTFLVRNTQAIDAYFYGDADFDTFRDSSLLPNNIQNLRKFSIEQNQRV